MTLVLHGFTQRARRLAAALATLSTVIAPIGCTSFHAPNPTVSGSYQGPPLSLTSSSDAHVVVFQAPSPGWTLSLDEVRDRLGGKNAFITLRQPDPKFAYAQVVVEQNLATSVPTDIPLALFARIAPHAADPSDNPYAEVRLPSPAR